MINKMINNKINQYKQSNTLTIFHINIIILLFEKAWKLICYANVKTVVCKNVADTFIISRQLKWNNHQHT